jgi:predicted MFS family arabinose efflux permease
VLLTPGGVFQALAGLAAQLTQGAAAIGIVLVVRQHIGSVALAGAVAGALGIAAGLARPVQGRLMDRHSIATVMTICGLVHPAALAGIVGVSLAHGPGVLLIVLGILAGLALAPVSTAMRVVWGEAVGDSDRTAAYSMVYLTQELALLVGPLVFAAAIAASSAAAGLVLVAVLSGIGTIAYAISVRSVDRSDAVRTGRRESPLKSGAMRLLLLVTIGLGGVVGGIEVGVPTLATAHGTPAVAGILIAVMSVGGIIGAAVYGARPWRADPAVRLLPLMVVITAAIGVTIATGNLAAVGLCLLIFGAAVNPALTTLSLLIDRATAASAAAEAFGWMSMGLAGGTGVAAAIAGLLVQHGRDATPAFALGAAAAALATAVAVAVRRG